MSKFYKHKVETILGLRIFVCYKMRHAYSCEQPFDYCPSCGFRITKQKEGNEK